MDEIELWNDVLRMLMNLLGVNSVAGVECLVQQPRDKITGTMIPWLRVGKFRVTEALVYGWWCCEDRCGEIM